MAEPAAPSTVAPATPEVALPSAQTDVVDPEDNKNAVPAAPSTTSPAPSEFAPPSAQTDVVGPEDNANAVPAAANTASPAPSEVAVPSAPTDVVDPEIRKNAILQEYRARVKAVASTGRAKPDMVAYSELRDKLTPASTHGHIPGVKLGEEYNGKGELAILGIHRQILRGIDFVNAEPKGAYAIVLSGGYGDDDDDGATIKYTGEGGQDSKRRKQERSQEFKGGNLALQRNMETSTPVRVCRGKLGASNERKYVYEGLYNVAAYVQEPSKSNPDASVIIFTLQAVPGQATASTKVEAGVFRKALSLSASQPLARSRTPSSAPRRRKRKRTPSHRAGSSRRGAAGTPEGSGESSGDEGDAAGYQSATEEQLGSRREKMLAEIRSRPGLVSEDVTGGTEPLPIPMFDDLDTKRPPPAFNYVADYALGEGCQAVAQASVAAFQEHRCRVMEASAEGGGLCGCKWMGWPQGNQKAYQSDGRLKATMPTGVYECPRSCTAPTCRQQRVCSRGVQRPLEVFNTGTRGWGVRVAEDVPVGTFLCCYVGRVILDSAAEELKAEDQYLFNLDHFAALHEELSSGPQSYDLDCNKLPPLPSDQKGGDHLVVDARTTGNVARFINHSCDPNCVIQPVFMREACGALFYYIGLFAQADIPAGREVTYNYGYISGSVAGRNLPCHCGAAACVGRIL